MNEDDNNKPDNDSDSDSDNIDFGYSTAIAGLLMAALLIIVMFATSGQV